MTDNLHPDFRRYRRPLVLLPALGLGLQLAAALLVPVASRAVRANIPSPVALLQ